VVGTEQLGADADELSLLSPIERWLAATATEPVALTVRLILPTSGRGCWSIARCSCRPLPAGVGSRGAPRLRAQAQRKAARNTVGVRRTSRSTHENAAHARMPRGPQRICVRRYDTYVEGIRHIDSFIARLHAVLAAAGRTEANTVFVVVGDHGRAFGEHGRHHHGHGRSLSGPRRIAHHGVHTGMWLRLCDLRVLFRYGCA
jgi:arylsulfatase A-like enzyme